MQGPAAVASTAITETPGSRPVPRTDLNQKLAQPLCVDIHQLSHMELWQKQVFDAQIQGFRVRPKGRKPLTTTALEKMAQEQSQRMGHGGFAHAICADGTGWFLTTPAARGVGFSDELLRIPAETLSASCREIYLDFASEHESSTRTVPLPQRRDASDWAINSHFLAAGSLSITCLPKQPDWQGPVLWSLVPIQKAKMAPPITVTFGGPNPAPEKLLAWVNELRLSSKIAPLQPNRHMDEAAQQLSQEATVTHDRRVLAKVRAGLEAHKLAFLGENRAQGKTLDDISWLFWASPRHRQLLMESAAKYIGISVRSGKNRHFVVMITARDAPAQAGTRVSKRP